MKADKDAHGFDRRVVLKGAAWSVPVLAMAASVPLAAASGPVAGNLGDYRWAPNAQGAYCTLEVSRDDNQLKFTTQVVWAPSGGWRPPPAGRFFVQVEFNLDVVFGSSTSLEWEMETSGPRSFRFALEPSGEAGALSFMVLAPTFADAEGAVTTAFMWLANGDGASWSDDVSITPVEVIG